MARQFMPKSSVLMPYIVVNRDAAVAGVFTVDGEGGSVDLTGKYVQISDYDQRVGSLESQVTTNTGDIIDLKTAVVSINGSISSINSSLSNKANKGANSDITSLTALSGPLRLGGDGVDAYDAVTFRQLQASSGSGSAAVNSVMNNFLGAVDWWSGTTARYPTGYLPASGQTVNRADYPELWAAIAAGTFTSITETSWQATATSRGVYSTGDGSTTFRMPDLNGAQSGSIAALFLRGSAQGDTGSGGIGDIRENATPNITGQVSFHGASADGSGFSPVSGVTGAFTNTGVVQSSTITGGTRTSVNAYPVADLSASRSNAAYGRNSSTEVRPNSIKGTWIIRVNGSFTSATTNFNVITGDATLPSTGTVVYGGDILSKYQVNGVDNTVARLRSRFTVGGAKVAEVGVVGGTNSLKVASDGGIVGVVDGSNASAGTVGEVISNRRDSQTGSHNVWISVTSITLTPGDWDVHGNVLGVSSSGSISQYSAGITTTTNSQPDPLFTTRMFTDPNPRFSVASQRFNVTANTTVYLTAMGVTSDTTGYQNNGYLWARRVR